MVSFVSDGPLEYETGREQNALILQVKKSSARKF